MKIFIPSLFLAAGLALVAWQHQQVGRLRMENASLAQGAAETDRLRADLSKFDGARAQDTADQIDRLQEENHDLLKLRNEVNQLRQTREEFQKVSAENQSLKSAAQSAPGTPRARVVINVKGLYDRGLNTPEDALQTFLWTQREGNREAMFRCVTPSSLSRAHDFAQGGQDYLNTIDLIEVAARREVNANTVQLGIIVRVPNRPENKTVFTFILTNGEWKVDLNAM